MKLASVGPWIVPALHYRRVRSSSQWLKCSTWNSGLTAAVRRWFGIGCVDVAPHTGMVLVPCGHVTIPTKSNIVSVPDRCFHSNRCILQNRIICPFTTSHDASTTSSGWFRKMQSILRKRLRNPYTRLRVTLVIWRYVRAVSWARLIRTTRIQIF